MKRTAILALFLCLMGASSLKATVMIEFTLDELVGHAEMVVQGKVKAVASKKDEKRGEIYTFVTVRVDGLLKGVYGGDEVILKNLGGALAGERSVVAGAPSFKVDERVILFLERRKDGYYRTLGLYQGKFVLVPDGERTLVLREQPAVEATLIRGDMGSPVPVGLDVDTFKARILSSL